MAGETDNLDLHQVAPAQSTNLDVSINDKGGQIDAAITSDSDILVDDSNAATITDIIWRRNLEYKLTDDSPVPDGAITITCPAIKRGLFVVTNDTSFTATIEITGQSLSSPTLLTGVFGVFVSDGVNIRKLV